VTHQSLIIDAVRTPVGRIGGALAGVRPDDLAAGAVRALVDRVPALDRTAIDEIYLGDANQAGEDNRNVARMAVLLAGLPTTIPGATVNRLCGSGLEGVIAASRAVSVGDAEIVLAGGVESMSRAPWVLPKPARAYPTGHEQLWSTTLGWRMTNPAMPDAWTVSLGEGAELLADKYSISRDEQDAFALGSHQKAVAAIASCRFVSEIVAMPTPGGEALSVDEGPRRDTSLEALAGLKPAFHASGSVTAGNSSQTSDGAAAVIVMDEECARAQGLRPLARLLGYATAGVAPERFGIGPVPAVRKLLSRLNVSLEAVDLIELNEAFAAQVLACLRELPIDPARLNVNGGAIALGHPLGCSGARLTTTLLYEMQRRGSRLGLVTLCVGGGMGAAALFEGMG
jgi:acetyl-CoA acetyltransferase family protein